MPAPRNNQNARKFARDRAVTVLTVRCLLSDLRKWKAKAREAHGPRQLSAWVTERLNSK